MQQQVTKDQFIALLDKYHRRELTDGEIELFLDAAEDPIFESLITGRLAAELNSEKRMTGAGAERENKVWNAIAIHMEQPAHVHIMRRWGWVAASAILLLAAGTYFLNKEKRPAAPVVAQHDADIAPGREGAILTLSDGSQVLLDSVKNGVVAQQGGATAKVVNGSLLYEANGGESVYNTTSTPKGRQFQLTLPDGSKVWLNAASSIRYPTAFQGKERVVEVAGEVYFEVAKQTARPFRVRVAGKTDVEVLGTHFNINAYANGNGIYTTLLEGAVRTGNVILKPGQQARMTDRKITVTDKVDIAKIMAWKNGQFNFDGMRLTEVMRELERWYDIEVVYEGNVSDIEFYGKLDRSISLSGVIAALKDAEIYSRIDGRKLIITQ